MMTEEDKHIEVDFSHRDTEASWIRILDDFAKKATPVWFNWLGWFLLLGALQYLFKKSQSVLVGVAIGISVGFLWLYFQAFFYGIKFKNVPLLRHFKNQRAVSIVSSGILAYLFWNASLAIVKAVMKNQ